MVICQSEACLWFLWISSINLNYSLALFTRRFDIQLSPGILRLNSPQALSDSISTLTFLCRNTTSPTKFMVLNSRRRNITYRHLVKWLINLNLNILAYHLRSVMDDNHVIVKVHYILIRKIPENLTHLPLSYTGGKLYLRSIATHPSPPHATHPLSYHD